VNSIYRSDNSVQSAVQMIPLFCAFCTMQEHLIYWIYWYPLLQNAAVELMAMLSRAMSSLKDNPCWIQVKVLAMFGYFKIL